MKKRFAVLGCPIEHSLSPDMHNSGYQALGIDASYEKICVTPSQIKKISKELKRKQYRGWNVTFPLKEAILPEIDILSPEAERAGAVNTILHQEGILKGFNTDGQGFIRFLEEEGFTFQGKTVTVLGAGGAAKAICTALLDYECKILIANRTVSKAVSLADLLFKFGGETEIVPFEDSDWLKKTDLLVNTTSVGMEGEDFPLTLQGISRETIVVDLIYRTRETPFLTKARNYGCQTYNGLGMLLYQGALAWEIWLEEQAPLAVMKEALLLVLAGGENVET